MLQFSEQLRFLITEKNIKIYSLASQSGIDRTLIQKMLKGDRLPSDKSIVLKLASSLLLSPAETERLLQSYYRAKMGERAYAQIKYIQQFFNNFSSLTSEKDFMIRTTYQHEITKLSNVTTIKGSLEINETVKTIIEMEAMKKDGYIKIIAQPEYSFLFQCLSLVGMNHPHLCVDHIICLEKSVKENEKPYNLKCINVIMPMLIAGLNYNPMCYYDNVDSHFSNNSILPYMILTSDYGINISYDLTYATIATSSSHLEICNRIFDEAEQKSIPMIKLLHSQMEHMEYLTEAFSSFGDLNFQFANAPVLHCFVPKEMLLKYVNHSLPDKEREHIINTTLQYNKLIKKSIETNATHSVFFSEKGLEQFLNTGEFTKYPAEYFTAFDDQDRYKLLKGLYDAGKSGIYHPIMVNTKMLNIPDNLSVSVYKDSAVSFLYMAPKHKYCVMIFTEKSIVNAFHDFFSYLRKRDLIFSSQETLSVIQQKLLCQSKKNIRPYFQK